MPMTPLLFLLWQAKISAVKKVCCRDITPGVSQVFCISVLLTRQTSSSMCSISTDPLISSCTHSNKLSSCIRAAGKNIQVPGSPPDYSFELGTSLHFSEQTQQCQTEVSCPTFHLTNWQRQSCLRGDTKMTMCRHTGGGVCFPLGWGGNAALKVHNQEVFFSSSIWQLIFFLDSSCVRVFTQTLLL